MTQPSKERECHHIADSSDDTSVVVRRTVREVVDTARRRRFVHGIDEVPGAGPWPFPPLFICPSCCVRYVELVIWCDEILDESGAGIVEIILSEVTNSAVANISPARNPRSKETKEEKWRHEMHCATVARRHDEL